MNRTQFSAALFAALLSSTAALAQPDHKDDQRGDSHGQGKPAAGAANRGGQDHGQDRGKGGGEAPRGQAPAGPVAARGDHLGRGPPAAPQQAIQDRRPNLEQGRTAQPAQIQRQVQPPHGQTFPDRRSNVEQSRPARSPPPIERQIQSNREARPSGFAQHGAANSGGRPGGGQFVYRGRPHEVIRGPSYSYPSGWSYRRWGSGQSLPFLFLSQSYFFGDYGRYGFGHPPRHYVWVRYGPDLLLVNRRTGRIREVIYGVFY